ncbi:cell division initiation protein [Caminicella sporogenes DSM 14501]|uniref:Cell division initiation protein n=1 Tax=Caminicella sporogenes DSM 14501 TaxID=1121266 RepID=A0A1M6LJD9_9FIRM|nr:DivIVA domain-containing protein [Caminicella sporogenes]RKD27850.1 septum formation initiator [Caminicella sporogenes]WIF94568.1 DivIVA domain-containing protein [Caminicella sporogenes]SHJ71317.1 cell division initiation protein [Caminicella sporogenes DSM 14501]
MITPLDIENKEFSKSFRGYNENEVDEFLEKIIESYEKLINENANLKEKNKLLEEQVEKYNSIERTLKDTLVVAQSAAEEVAVNANKKAELIIKEAEEKAKKIIENANDEVLKINRKYEELKKDFQIFKTRFKTLLESQLKLLDTSEEDMNLD